MKARFVPLLAASVWLSACANKPSVTPAMAKNDHAEFLIHAPSERVQLAIITERQAAGATLANQSENRLIFVAQFSGPLRTILDDLKPSGAPYLRATYTLASDANGTRVSIANELVNDYGTASERSRPFDPVALRRDQQRELRRVQAGVEKK